MTNRVHGVYLPIVTPFINEQVDYSSYKKLLNFYIDKNIHGIIPLATTGEVPTIDEDEYHRILDITLETINGRIPIYAGISGNNTKKIIEKIKEIDKYHIEGYLIASPYFNLPSQQGIYEHFMKISESTIHNIIIYNIPHRTGRNIENETILKLSLFKNIIGIKDSCQNISQSIELLREKDSNFSVLTGDDILFYFNITNGGDGGILSSAHINTEKFINIYNLIKKNDHINALNIWNKISVVIPLLFKEPNPSPIKYILGKKGLISSDQVRLPLTKISESLQSTFDKLIKEKIIE